MLCSVNSFDAYLVTRVSKAPKAFVFAVKSTDNITYFESTSDYVHIFSCDEKEGLIWLEKILLTRVRICILTAFIGWHILTMCVVLRALSRA